MDHNTGYEIGSTQDPLDYPAKAERCDYKTNFTGCKDLAEARMDAVFDLLVALRLFRRRSLEEIQEITFKS